MRKQDFALEIASDPSLLRVVRNLVRSYLLDAGFSGARVDELVLGVDEACTNAIRHGCEGTPDATFKVIFRTGNDWMEIQLEDSGEPASPEAFVRDEPGGPANAADLRPGGLGVQLIHQVFDAVEFCPGEIQGNCITMKLKLPK